MTTTATGDLDFTLTGPSGATNELYVSFGNVPTQQSFDARGIRAGSANQSVSLAGAQVGTYYILVYGASAASGERFTLTADKAGFSLSSVSPTQGSNTGQVTMNIFGAQFDINSQPRLIDSAGKTIIPLHVYYTDTGLISATFDLTGQPLGPADVQVVNTGNVIASLPHGFDLIAGQPGELVTSITAPSGVRIGREFPIYINYQNTGNTDLVAPIMQLVGNGDASLSLYSDLSTTFSSIDLIATNPLGPAGILPPGSAGQITVYGSGVASGTDVLQVEPASYPTTPINYSAVASAMRPPGLSDADWTAIFTRLQKQLGSTWTSYVNALSNDSTLLPPSLGLNYSVQDVFEIEVEKGRAALGLAAAGDLFLGDTAHTLSDPTITIVGQNTGDVFTTSASFGWVVLLL